MTTPYWSDFVPNSIFYRILSGFHRTFATGVHADRGHLLSPLRTPGPFPFGICIYSSNRNHTTYLWRLLNMTFTEIYITDFERFQQNICNGCGMPTGDAYSSGHLIPSLWDLHMFYLLRPILFRTCHYFTGLCSSNIPRYFLDFAFDLFMMPFTGRGS